MGDVDQLLRGILDDPEDEALRLVLADWLEERGDDVSLARARLIRMQVDRARAAEGGARWALDADATAVMKKHPGLLRPLAPLDQVVPVLSLAELPLFLGAPLAGVHGGPLAAGSTWEGHLRWERYSFPTTFRIRKRRGNDFSGDMTEDFSAYFGAETLVTFFFRGVVFGRERIAFVTHRVDGPGDWPCLYELRLGHAGWLSGTWWSPHPRRRWAMRLRHRRGA